MITQEPELEISWTGATWRSFPQPQIAREESTRRHLSDEIRAYLGGRPGRWIVTKEIAQVLDCLGDDLRNRLRWLIELGEVESSQIEKWGARRRAYRWVSKPETPKPARRVRPTAAQYEAMRARLQAAQTARSLDARLGVIR